MIRSAVAVACGSPARASCRANMKPHMIRTGLQRGEDNAERQPRRDIEEHNRANQAGQKRDVIHRDEDDASGQRQQNFSARRQASE